ncbi:DUF6718 family protein [Clostridium botulinum]|uniref:Uncharacterized protein n=1 Tax=Clostridium botulinum (strain Kyoto / Type A2) TaxID=536232 RepID=C1FP95_CLOBJ|nr:DUF6718 family protein [Clostridium botulinum]ACO86870.1 conserved hypothetical protein [Clostridium botulinum A2 str. Kyoto]AUN07033.1 hypothetical protein RSJ14_10070 [Clostridium botulinum]MBN3364713.1 hypothetical protein [Clostridium botulinum]MBN3373738.1 hypothetical protein [Clostridium botulinum]MBN3385469.1 hypothetical protein [Clostridium botulinum]
MCYLIVKDFNKKGSIAIELNDNKEVAGLSKFLTARLKDTSKQVVTISDLETWEEYAPFNIVNNASEFIDKAEKM